VIHASHVLRPDGSNMGVLRELVPKVRDGLLNAGAESAALHRTLVVGPRDLLLEKPRFGAFHGTDLELILRGTRHRHRAAQFQKATLDVLDGLFAQVLTVGEILHKITRPIVGS